MLYERKPQQVTGTIVLCECGRQKLFVWDETPSVSDPAGIGRWRVFEEVAAITAPQRGK